MANAFIVRRGGGGGSLKATDAILRVIAPAGSTVTISKGGASKSDAGHENHDDATLYDYYFIIHQSQFDSVNPWTVTATLGADTATDTVIIDSADEYDLVMSYWDGELYDSGNEYTAVTGGWTVLNGVGMLTKNASSMVSATSSTSDASIVGMLAFDPSILANYTTYNIEISANSSAGNGNSYLRVNSSADGRGTNITSKTIAKGTTGTVSVDISSISSGYPVFTNWYSTITISKIWLS